MAAQARLAPAIDRKGLSGPALRTFLRIAESWELSVDEQMILLGVTARSTYFKWKKDPMLFRTLYDDGFPGLFDAAGARISKIIRSLPERRTGAHSV